MKRSIAKLLVIALVCTLLIPANSVALAAGGPTKNQQNVYETFPDISQDFPTTFNAEYNIETAPVDITSAGTYRIYGTNTSTTNTVTVAANVTNVILLLENVTIDLSGQSVTTSPIHITEGSSVTMYIKDAVTLTGVKMYPAISVNTKHEHSFSPSGYDITHTRTESKIHITGSGSLTATGGAGANAIGYYQFVNQGHPSPIPSGYVVVFEGGDICLDGNVIYTLTGGDGLPASEVTALKPTIPFINSNAGAAIHSGAGTKLAIRGGSTLNAVGGNSVDGSGGQAIHLPEPENSDVSNKIGTLFEGTRVITATAGTGKSGKDKALTRADFTMMGSTKIIADGNPAVYIGTPGFTLEDNTILDVTNGGIKSDVGTSWFINTLQGNSKVIGDLVAINADMQLTLQDSATWVGNVSHTRNESLRVTAISMSGTTRISGKLDIGPDVKTASGTISLADTAHIDNINIVHSDSYSSKYNITIGVNATYGTAVVNQIIPKTGAVTLGTSPIKYNSTRASVVTFSIPKSTKDITYTLGSTTDTVQVLVPAGYTSAGVCLPAGTYNISDESGSEFSPNTLTTTVSNYPTNTAIRRLNPVYENSRYPDAKFLPDEVDTTVPTISDASYDLSDNPITITSNGVYEVTTSSTTANSLEVAADVAATIILNNVSIDKSPLNSNLDTTIFRSGVMLQPGSQTVIYNKGDSKIVGSITGSAISAQNGLSKNTRLTLTGEGNLILRAGLYNSAVGVDSTCTTTTKDKFAGDLLIEGNVNYTFIGGDNDLVENEEFYPNDTNNFIYRNYPASALVSQGIFVIRGNANVTASGGNSVSEGYVGGTGISGEYKGVLITGNSKVNASAGVAMYYGIGSSGIGSHLFSGESPSVYIEGDAIVKATGAGTAADIGGPDSIGGTVYVGGNVVISDSSVGSGENYPADLKVYDNAKILSKIYGGDGGVVIEASGNSYIDKIPEGNGYTSITLNDNAEVGSRIYRTGSSVYDVSILLNDNSKVDGDITYIADSEYDIPITISDTATVLGKVYTNTVNISEGNGYSPVYNYTYKVYNPLSNSMILFAGLPDGGNLELTNKITDAKFEFVIHDNGNELYAVCLPDGTYTAKLNSGRLNLNGVFDFTTETSTTLSKVFASPVVYKITYTLPGYTGSLIDIFGAVEGNPAKEIVLNSGYFKAGYTFDKWYTDQAFTTPYVWDTLMTSNLNLYGRMIPKTDTQYKIMHYQENLLDNQHTLKDTDTSKGTTDTTVTATSKNYDGFDVTLDSSGNLPSGIIAGNGTTQIKVYYTRQLLTVTGVVYSGENDVDITVKYGGTPTLTTPTMSGYTFVDWYTDSTFITPYVPGPILSNITIYAKWIANTDIAYTVKHYQQNISDDMYTLESTIPYTGITDTTVTAEAKTYTGFTVRDDLPTGKITGDGSLTLDIYYDRESYTIKNDQTADEEVLRYGSTLTAPTATDKLGYTFIAWCSEDTLLTEIDFSAPVTSNLTMYPKYAPNTDTKYTVRHLQQNLLDDEYAVIETEDTLTGTTDTTITATTKNYNGFHLLGPAPTGTITADGLLVLDVKYDRDLKDIIFDTAAPIKVKYGTTIIKPVDPTRDGYTFDGWYKDSELKEVYDFETVVTENITIFAKWTDNYVPPTGGIGGGGWTTTEYKITINKTGEGSVTITKPTYSSRKLEFKPAEGFTIAKVLINGKEVELKDNVYNIMSLNKDYVVDVTFVGPEKPCHPNTYLDIDNSAWYHPAVDYVLATGIMRGVENGHFAPNTTTSRAEVTQMLFNLSGEDIVMEAPIFKDVTPNYWYTNAIVWATKYHIVNGLDVNTFAPSLHISREQFVAMLYRYAKSEVDSTTYLDRYTDKDEVSDWAIDAMNWGVRHGILKGRSNSTINPKETVTRAECAAMMYQYSMYLDT